MYVYITETLVESYCSVGRKQNPERAVDIFLKSHIFV